MKKNLFVPIATCLVLFFMTSCASITDIKYNQDIQATVEFLAAQAGQTSTTEAIETNLVKQSVKSKNINSDKIKSIQLTKVTAVIEENSTLDFADIESVTVVVNGIEWAKLPVNASGKTANLTVSNADVKSTVIDADQITFVYTGKAKKATPIAKVTFTMMTQVTYETI
jgi:hypothetical protein